MQKARRHPKWGSDRLYATGFRNSFTPLRGVLFTFPSRYLCTIGLSGVFSLTGWSRLIHAEFLVIRVTQDTAGIIPSFGYRAVTFFGGAFQLASIHLNFSVTRSYYPVSAVTDAVWAPPRSLATTGGITLVFFSCGY